MAQRVGRDIALLFHDRGTRSGWVVSSTPQPQFTPRKDPVPITKGAGWAPGSVLTGRKSLPHRDLIPDRPAHSQSLYRLSYGAHVSIRTFRIYCSILVKFSVTDLHVMLSTGVKFRENRPIEGCSFLMRAFRFVYLNCIKLVLKCTAWNSIWLWLQSDLEKFVLVNSAVGRLLLDRRGCQTTSPASLSCG